MPEPISVPARAITLPEPVQRGVSVLLDQLQVLSYDKIFNSKVLGRGNIPHHTNAIVVANHCSHLDVGLVKQALGEYGAQIVSAGARDYFFSSTLHATYFENFTNVVAFDRHDSVRQSLSRFVSLIHQGKRVLIFPEGTRSVTGRMGAFIEPVIAPLGYDGRMGVALIASFAAREVFVGTMATLYASPESDEGIGALKERLGREINPKTGQPILNAATALSLIVFYMLAMQCLSTVAIVRQELGGWKWALLQAGGMTVLAYWGAWAAYAALNGA